MVAGVDSRWLFLGLVILVALERIVELRIAERNRAAMLARGGLEVGQGHYPWMVLLHTSFLLAAPLEVFAFARPWRPLLGWSMLAVLVATMALRYWVIASLGGRWTTRVVLVPGEPAIRRGPFRWFRHPNYLAVVLEIIALPLVHGAWWTATIFTVANAILLRTRIRAEESALGNHSDYLQRFDGVASFPGTGR